MDPVFDIAKQRKAWSAPPVGGMNIPCEALHGMNDLGVLRWSRDIYDRQYSQPSSWNGLYRKHLKLDTTTGARVLDYGSGFGMDALSYAMKGNQVSIADIVPGNLRAATRVLTVNGFLPRETILLVDNWHFTSHPFDVFHSSGVLHHTPYIRSVLARAAEFLASDGEIRLMLYTDHLWRQATQTDPGPVDQPVYVHPLFARFVRWCDDVGDYADWYTPEKLQYVVGDIFTLVSFEYIREDSGYCVAILKPRGG